MQSRSSLSPLLWLLTLVALQLPRLPGHAQSPAPDLFQNSREQLVRDYIESAGVKNQRVLRAMRETPRHEFVPRALRSQAYLDMALPIGDSQTISSPFIVAWMTEAIDPKPTDKVLEIGTGSGYQAAVLSPLVDQVYTIEIVKSLGEKAADVLKSLDYKNVHVRVGDGFLGWPEQAPFDKIIVTCSPESVPQPLVDQLRDGGQMIIPVGERYQQMLYLMTKVDGKLQRTALQPTLFVPMTGQAEATRKQQPDAKNPKLINGDFEMPWDQNAAPQSAVNANVPSATGEIAGAEAQSPAPPSDAVPGWYYGRQVKLVSGEAPSGKSFIRFQNQTPELSSHLLQGLPLDGREVISVRVSGMVRTEAVKTGSQTESLPAIAVSFYDDQRRDVGTFLIGPFRGTKGWREHSRVIRVPPQAREAIIRIGLFGATGTADFDNLKLDVVR